MAEALRNATEPMPYERIAVKRMAGALGAEIEGADLARLDDATFAEIHRAFLEHQAIFFRGQDIAPDQYLAFAKRWGGIHFYPYMKGLDSHPEIFELVKTEDATPVFGNRWHSDQMYTPIPAKATMLYAKELPAAGGDTMFANLYLAYDALSDGMKRILEGVIGINSGGLKHKKGGPRAAHHARIGTMTVQNADKADGFESRHPVVRTHPDTGQKSLYVSSLHTIRFDGMTEEESKPLIDFLNDHCIEPEFSCRVRWEPGQLTIWDNRCTMHNAINDYHGYRRRMRRLTVGPEAPR